MKLLSYYSPLFLPVKILLILISLQSVNSFAGVGSSYLNLTNWSLDGDIIAELRSFPINDQDDHTKELAFDFSSHLKIEFENDLLKYKLALLARYGVLDKGRNAFVQEENFVSLPFGDFTFTAGYQIHSWYVLEGFRVSDILNSRNLDGDYERIEKFGELTLSMEYFSDYFTLSLFYFPLYIDPYWPESSSRSAPKTSNSVLNTADIASSIWVEGNNIKGDEFGHQGAIKLTKSFEDYDLDIDLYSIHHMDRTQPFITISNDLKVRGHHFRVTQSGVNVSKVYGNWIFKFEGAVRDFNADTYQPILQGPIIRPKDHSMVAGGIETNITLIEGISSTLYIEWQKILGVELESTEQYTPFQNDLFVALRSDFNDVMGRVITLATFVDLEKQYELAFALSYSQRLTDSWSLAAGGRLIHSLNSDNPKGLDLFRNSDNVYFKLTRFY
ncbi:MAG: hypothetical protein HN576_00860 [Bacteriovoracaceae bacterium]|jgi:hypothetical protein|nr:hypothetical protein [Bacteriovoracaceae bacterium]